MPEARPGPWWRWLALSAVVAAADLATKAWVSAAFQVGDVHVVTPFFNLVLWHNPGAAFSFLAGAGGWQRWFFVAVTLAVSAVILAMLRKSGGNRLLATALALVLGGALGNLWDRLTLGHVVDFIQLHAAGYYWPAFNVADSAITVGVVLILWDGVRDARAARAGQPHRSVPP
ncbi:MAG: lipoprotein signal peptidase [Burkholderiales bacterium]|jgi:signal peptidase II|nr:lipoprotein signal peptidase [Burkholderiales bacterium]